MLVLVALWMPIAILVATFVIDVGHWYVHKRHLQLQADAAVLAGGALFGACFNTGGGDPTIFSEATKYAGRTGTWNGVTFGTPLYNEQIGGTHRGPVDVRYQADRYVNDTVARNDGTETQGPCETASLMFDVKATESQLPWFLSASVVPAINAHARVQLRGLSSASPDLPLALPDINPKEVKATFINEGTGVALSGCTGPAKVTGTTCTFALAKGAPAGGLNMWSTSYGPSGGPASVTLPTAPAKIGVRIGIGGQVGTCVGTSGVAGSYFCYDGTSNSGLAMIRDYAVGTATTSTPPALDGVWPRSCSGTSFFFLASGTCTGNVDAEVNFGTGTSQPNANYHVRAAVGGTTLELRPVSFNAARNAWLWSFPAGTSFALASAAGPLPLTMSWEINDTTINITGLGQCRTGGSNPCRGTFANEPQQRFYSGVDDRSSGPIRSLQLGGSSEPNGPASLVAGSHSLTVTVGIAGNYQLNSPCTPPPSGKAYSCPTDPPVPLRLKDSSGSTTYAVDCGGIGSGANLLLYMIEKGCTNAFSLNANGVCAPPNPVDPPDCAPVGSVGVGLKTGPTRQALNNRFAPGGTCLTNNYPIVNPDNDKRVVLVMITDFSAFDSSGSGVMVPIMTMGAFYVTGWEGAIAGCNTQNDPPPGGVADTGEIWGHFIKYVLVKGVGGTTICDPAGLVPCVPVLTE